MPERLAHWLPADSEQASQIRRGASKRQIPAIGALSDELGIVKEISDWQLDTLISFAQVLHPGTFRRRSGGNKDSGIVPNIFAFGEGRAAMFMFEELLCQKQRAELERDG